jgi:hypothetical protein
MKKPKLLKRLLIMLSAMVTVWLFWPSMQSQQQVMDTEVLNHVPITKITKPSVSVETKPEPQLIPKNITSNASVALVAKVYAAELTFPPYSQPLTDKDFDRLEPNYFNPQSIPVDDEGTQVTAALSKYRYIYPEQVVATLAGKNIANAELELVDTRTGKLLLSTRFEQGEEGWYAELDGKRDLPRQLQATVKARINGKNITLALAIQYVDSIATLEGFGSAYNEDADMVLPANLTTREKGLYRVRANLFDAKNQPIAHLVKKERFDKGSSHINLKAHQSVLQGRQPPFYLSTFSIELMSPAPGKPVKYGNSEIKKYEIKDFALSSLSDTPYQASVQEKQRLLLLQSMAEGE